MDGASYKMKILCVLESLTGNTYSFVQRVQEGFVSDSDTLLIYSPRELLKLDKEEVANLIEDADKIMIGCYTWDMGKIPKKTKQFVIEFREQILAKREEEALIFGSGWTVYETYCKAVDSVGLILDHKFPKIKFELVYDKNRDDCKEQEKTLYDFMKEGK